VASDQLSHILSRLADAGGGTVTLCHVAAEVLEVSGAGIMLIADGTAPTSSVCTSNEVSATIEELQYTLGEGPCVDAFQKDRPVAEPDLADPEVSRWPAFTPPAVAAGARAVFGFPVQVGAARLGALNLYRDEVGPLSAAQHADSVLMASVAARAVLALQAGARPGALAAELEAGAGLRFVVHQAAGMVAVQLEVGVAEALVRLRAHAFSEARPLNDVAEDVVARRLRFEPGGP
jgi:hypothetical protein